MSEQAQKLPNHIDTHVSNYFEYEHLPDHLKEISRPFAALAETIRQTLPMSAETAAALRKLLEAKDCAVRVAVTNHSIQQSAWKDSDN